MSGLPWFRLYTEFASDPKTQILAFEDQRHFVMLLCLKGNGTLDANTPNDSYRERLIAKALGLDPLSATEAKRRLLDGGLIDSRWSPLKWEARQFPSDHSTPRVQKYREKISRNVTETLPKRHETVRDKKRLEEIRRDSEKSKRPLECAEFSDLKALYPPRAGDQPWREALKQATARIKEGHSWSQMLDGVRRYSAYIRCKGDEGTEFVKQAKTFLGPDKPFLLPWDPPKTKTDNLRDANVDASREWLNGSQ